MTLASIVTAILLVAIHGWPWVMMSFQVGIKKFQWSSAIVAWVWLYLLMLGLFLGDWHRIDLSRVFGQTLAPRYAVLALFLGALIAATFHMLHVPMFRVYAHWQTLWVRAQQSGGLPMLTPLLGSIALPAFQELLFRGIYPCLLETVWPFLTTAVVSAYIWVLPLMFGQTHWGIWLYLLFGVLLAYLRRCTNSLLAPCLCHFAFMLSVLWM